MGGGAGSPAGVGLALAAAMWTSLALLGLDGLLRLFPWAYAALKTAGALYLIYLAWTSWRSADRPVGHDDGPARRAFFGGALVNLANPKSVFFAASVLVVVFPADLAWSEKALIVLNHALVEIIVYAGFAALLGTRRVANGYLRLKPALDRAVACLLEREPIKWTHLVG